MKDPYAALGVAKTATDKEIRSAYRKLAKQYHPDHNQGNVQAEERFKAVGQAYAILGDKEKRARFDRGEIDAEGKERGPFGPGGFGGGAQGFYGQGFGGQGFGAQGGGPGADFSQEDLGAFFSDMFGGGGAFRSAGRPARGEDRRYAVTISFEQSILGDSLDLSLGEGSGYTTVRIPPGIEDGATLRVRGKGGSGRPGRDGQPGPAGDALLTVSVRPDPRYVREGRNLRVVQDIDLKTAVLGGKIHVQTPKGTVALSVRPHSDSGMVLRLAGRGVAADKRHPAGDMLVVLRIVLGGADPVLEAFLRQQEH